MVAVFIWYFLIVFLKGSMNYLLGYLWELRCCDGSGNDGRLWLGAIGALLYFFHSNWEQIDQYYRLCNNSNGTTVCGGVRLPVKCWDYSAVACALSYLLTRLTLSDRAEDIGAMSNHSL